MFGVLANMTIDGSGLLTVHASLDVFFFTPVLRIERSLSAVRQNKSRMPSPDNFFVFGCLLACTKTADSPWGESFGENQTSSSCGTTVPGGLTMLSTNVVAASSANQCY